MQPNSSGQGAKQGWFIIFGALVFSVAVYALMVFFIAQSPGSHPKSLVLAQARPVIGALGVASLVASVIWLLLSVGGGAKAKLLSYGQFQTRTLIALALAEICALLGLLLFFLGASFAEFGQFALGTLAVDFAFILPSGIAFWARQK